MTLCPCLCLSGSGARRRRRRQWNDRRLDASLSEHSTETYDTQALAATTAVTSSSGLMSLEMWSDAVRTDVFKSGFFFAYRKHIDRLASVSLDHPRYVPKLLDSWLRIDPDTAHHLDHLDIDSVQSPSSPLLQDTTPPLVSGLPEVPETDTDPPLEAGLNSVVESTGQPVQVYHNAVWTNRSRTLTSIPTFTFRPRSRIGVINVVRFALSRKMRVRVSAGRHCDSPLYAASGDVCIAFSDHGLPNAIPVANDASFSATHEELLYRSARLDDLSDTALVRDNATPPQRVLRDTELERVTMEGSDILPDGRRVAHVRVSAAATAEHFRQWALSEAGGNWRWMLPSLPDASDMCSAAWTQVIRCGSGFPHATLVDRCIEVEVVNCRGEVQVVRDRSQIRAVAGAFGLFGVILSQVFVVDTMKLANCLPEKIPIIIAVPPLRTTDVPNDADFTAQEYSEDILFKSRIRFELDCRKFYSEWRWYPFQRDCWINCWDEEENTGARPRFPDAEEARRQQRGASLIRMLEVAAIRALPARWQAQLYGFSAMHFLPSSELLRSNIPDALHSRRYATLKPSSLPSARAGEKSFEMMLEIAGKVDGSPDFSTCQQAWWIIIKAVYNALPDIPVRSAVSMRVAGGSDATLAPHRGNMFGTCVVKVCTRDGVDDDLWRSFVQKITDKLAALKHPLTERPLRVRPSLVYQWPQFFNGHPFQKFLIDDYALQIAEFRKLVAAACADGGYTFHDCLRAFGNDALLDFIADPATRRQFAYG